MPCGDQRGNDVEKLKKPPRQASSGEAEKRYKYKWIFIHGYGKILERFSSDGYDTLSNKTNGDKIMLKCLSVYTHEIDDPQVALEEIQTQLKEKITLLEHSVGIVMCNPEYILSGVLKHVCENLPFDTVGVTTSSQAVNGDLGEMMLSIFVMTADDVRFKAGVTQCLDKEVETPCRSAYEQLADGEQPTLILAFPPLILKYAGDTYVNIWEQLAPGAPVFGTLAIDDTVSFSESETIYNGDSSKTSMSFVLCYGNINPRFVVGTLPENNALPYRGEITKSEGPFVAEINDINAYKYFEDLGFAKDGNPTDNFLFVPFMIDQKNRTDYDGIPVMRVLTSFTKDGTAIFRGNVDESSTFTLLKCTPEDVISNTVDRLGESCALGNVNGILSFSCIIRRMVSMGIDSMLELENARNKIGDIPFMMGYAGGEICPTSVRSGVPTNRFHNYSLITLVV